MRWNLPTGGGVTYFFSYKTLVAVSVPGVGLAVVKNYWGTTTGKHLNWIDGGSKERKIARLTQDAFNAFLVKHQISEAA